MGEFQRTAAELRRDVLYSMDDDPVLRGNLAPTPLNSVQQSAVTSETPATSTVSGTAAAENMVASASESTIVQSSAASPDTEKVSS